MYILVPANVKQLAERATWFKNSAARQLSQEKNVGFGFEIKGEPETVNPSAGGQPLYWGYHLPNDFASEWYYHPERQKEMLKSLTHLAALQPNYITFHGIHLWWQPPSQEYIHRYANHSEQEEYLKVIEANIQLIKELKKIFGDIYLTEENYPLYMYYQRDGKYIPETFLYTGTGRLNDLLYFKEKTGIGILLDLEHLILTLNFLNRRRNYCHLPLKKISRPNQKLRDIFGFVLDKDTIPYADPAVDLAAMIKKYDAKLYHLTGSVQDVIAGKRILTHEPIETDNQTFRKNLRLILNRKPEAMLVETADSTVNPCWHYLRPNETELSFYHLCQILLEEL